MKVFLLSLLLISCVPPEPEFQQTCYSCYRVIEATCVGSNKQAQCRAVVNNEEATQKLHITIYQVVIPDDTVCLYNVKIRDLMNYNEWRISNEADCKK